MKNIFSLIVFIFTLIAKSQGCSDAGFCTIGDFEAENQNKSSIIIATTFAKGENNINIFSPYIEYNRSISEKWMLQSKITFQNASLNGINNFGIGDIFLATSYKFNEKFNGFMGTKIPLSQPDVSKNSVLLPMEYQSSLGTFDALIGFNYNINNFKFGFSYQQPITQNNKGFWGDYQRSPDVLCKANYNWKLNEKWKFEPGTQFIYHLYNDKSNGKEILNSNGLTINAILNFNYKISPKNSITFLLASPIIVRKERPDGLTRKFVSTLQYQFDF